MQIVETSAYRFDHPRTSDSNSTMPRWDPETNVLYLGEVIVKRYQRPARSQHTILAAFEEEGWPARINDPLVVQLSPEETRSKWRLRSTVNDLNRAQYGCIRIRFHLDGTGHGIRWTIQIV